MQNHIIHSQKVILEIPAAQEAHNYQNTVSRLFNNGLHAAVEKILDSICMPGEVVRINNLNLDLGEISAQRFETEFKEKVIASLTKATSKSRHAADNETNTTIVRQPVSQRQAFVYFAMHGVLPWYSNVKSCRQWEEELIMQWQPADWQFAAQWLSNNGRANIIQRLVWQFSGKFLSNLGEHVNEVNTGQNNLPAETLVKWHKDLVFISRQTHTQAENEAAVKIWVTILNVVLRTGRKKAGEYIIAELILKQLPANSKDAATFIKNNTAQLLQGVITKEVNDVLFDIVSAIENNQPLAAIEWYILHDNVGGLNNISQGSAVAGADNSNGNTENNNNNKVEVAKDAGNQPGKQKAKKSEPENVLYVNNCGLVLLHPFLGAYFSDIGLMQKKQFVDDEARQRAILLLHYLATGETESAEFNLVIQKVLCGYDIGETLPAVIDITAKEIEESKKLLRTVIDYWPPLKNTSIEGFQITFLQRQGRLSAIQSGWLLRIEQKAVDILLGKLPWGFSTIRLSWMTNMMNVDWA